MKNTKALFLCNEKFLDNSLPEGGVKFCTDEFRALLQTGFDLEIFPVQYASGFLARAKKRLGLHAYADYQIQKYRSRLKEKLIEDGVKHVFLNLSNTAPFAKLIKELSPETKVILCSHGNESGDFLHDISTHGKMRGVMKTSAQYNLGKMLVQEAEQRKNIGLVLTVSDIEVGIEKWLGAHAVYMVPRFIGKAQALYDPILGRVGFFSDLSHEPNYHGISAVCEALNDKIFPALEIRIAGGGAVRGKALADKYSFVTYLGYLPGEELMQEISRWSFALNPVLYYSRGVSTKLGKSLGLGLPVITTEKGMRGYYWTAGELPVCNNAAEMAALIVKLSADINAFKRYHQEVRKIQDSSPSFELMMADILKLL